METQNIQNNNFQNTQSVNIVYAGFLKRLAAFIIDWVISVLIGFVVGFILGIIFSISARFTDVNYFGPTAESTNFIFNLVGILISWLYFAVLESSKKQATFGKMALGIIVTDLEGNRISFAKATGRYFAKILSAVLLFVGFIMIGATSKKQGLHDKLAGCLVVNKK